MRDNKKYEIPGDENRSTPMEKRSPFLRRCLEFFYGSSDLTMKEYLQEDKELLKTCLSKAMKILGIAVVTLFLFFWYISGSALGLVKFFHAYYVTTKFAMDAPAKEDLFLSILKGIVRGTGDKYSAYLDKEQMDELEQHTSSSYSGIGLLIDMSGDKVKVGALMEGQPAEAAGLQKGDEIIAINGTPIESIQREETAEKIRGEEGTFVVLQVLRNGESMEFSIERKHIVMPTVKGKMIDDHIGYIRISQFAEKTVEDFSATYKELQEKGMTRLILDLRDNPGGLLQAAHGIGSYLVPSGPIVTVDSRATRIRSQYVSEGKGDHIPLVVLINGHSASASEIVAGAVQDTKSGMIVGTKSYGKGTVQSVIPGLDGEGIKITISRYKTPNDRIIDGIGIEPDQIVEPSDGEEDLQLDKAIEIVKTL